MIEFDLQVFLIQAATFLVALALLHLIAFKPLKAMLEARTRKIGDDLDAAEQARKSAAAAEQAAERERAELRSKADDVVRKALEESRKERDAVLRQAQKQGENLVAEAEKRMAEEQAKAITALRNEATSLAVSLAEKVMAESLSQTAHDKLIDQAVDAVEFSAGKN